MTFEQWWEAAGARIEADPDYSLMMAARDAWYAATAADPIQESARPQKPPPLMPPPPPENPKQVAPRG